MTCAKSVSLALVALVLVALAAPVSAAVCELRPIEPSVTCGQAGAINVVWGYYSNCGTPTFTIERACCPAGRWTTIATNVTGNSYLDPSGHCTNVKYRITINCPSPCGCTGTCQYVTPCISCLEISD